MSRWIFMRLTKLITRALEGSTRQHSRQLCCSRNFDKEGLQVIAKVLWIFAIARPYHCAVESVPHTQG